MTPKNLFCTRCPIVQFSSSLLSPVSSAFIGGPFSLSTNPSWVVPESTSWSLDADQIPLANSSAPGTVRENKQQFPEKEDMATREPSATWQEGDISSQRPMGACTRPWNTPTTTAERGACAICRASRATADMPKTRLLAFAFALATTDTLYEYSGSLSQGAPEKNPHATTGRAKPRASA